MTAAEANKIARETFSNPDISDILNSIKVSAQSGGFSIFVSEQILNYPGVVKLQNLGYEIKIERSTDPFGNGDGFYITWKNRTL
jgi:hypothetical protein